MLYVAYYIEFRGRRRDMGTHDVPHAERDTLKTRIWENYTPSCAEGKLHTGTECTFLQQYNKL